MHQIFIISLADRCCLPHQGFLPRRGKPPEPSRAHPGILLSPAPRDLSPFSHKSQVFLEEELCEEEPGQSKAKCDLLPCTGSSHQQQGSGTSLTSGLGEGDTVSPGGLPPTRAQARLCSSSPESGLRQSLLLGLCFPATPGHSRARSGVTRGWHSWGLVCLGGLYPGCRSMCFVCCCSSGPLRAPQGLSLLGLS